VETSEPDFDPNAVVKVKTTDGVLSLAVLVEQVGKELKLNFLYEDAQPVAGQVLLQTYGQIRRRDLTPLLESVLSFHGYAMLREGSFVRIRKKDASLLKRTEPAIVISKEPPAPALATTVVTQILKVEHVKPTEVQALLALFISDPGAIMPIGGTNYLIITEYANRMGLLLNMAALLDRPGPPRRLEPIEVKYLTAAAAKARVQELLTELAAQGASTVEAPAPPAPQPARPSVRPVAPGSPGAGTPPEASGPVPTAGQPSPPGVSAAASVKGAAMFVDERTNRLLVIGTDEQIRQVKDLLAILDVEQPGPKIELTPLTVVHVTASDAKTRIDALLQSLREQGTVSPGEATASAATTIATIPGQPPALAGRPAIPARPTPSSGTTAPVSRVTEKPPVIHVDERTNRLLVVGTAGQTGNVKELLELIDVEAGPEIKLEVFRVEHVDPEQGAAQLENLIRAINEQSAGTGVSEATPAPSPSGAPRPTAPPPSTGRPGTPTGGTTPGASQPVVTSGRVPKGPAVFVDQRNSRLLVVGSDAQMQQVRDLLKVLDVAEGPEITLEPIRVAYVLASEVAVQIRDLIDALNEQGGRAPGGRGQASQPAPQPVQPGGPAAPRAPAPTATSTTGRSMSGGRPTGPALFVDERTNRLLVVGSAEQIRQVKHLLALLDVKEGPEIRLVALTIQNVVADDVAKQLEQLVGAFAEQRGEIMPGATGAPRATVASSPATGTAGATDRSAPPGGARDRAAPAPSARPRGTRGSGGRTEGAGPFILVDDRTNRLLVVGSHEQIDQLTELLTVLDVPPSEYFRLYLRVYQPQYVEAAEVQKILDTLGITKPERVPPREQARQGRAGAAATPAGQPRLGAAGGEAQPTVILAQMGEGPAQLLPGQEEPEIRIAVQESTNKLFVLATDYQHRDIAEILRQVDMELPVLGAVQIYPLENRKPKDVATMLQDLLETEKKMQEQAGGGVTRTVTIPGKEGSPIVVALEDIYAVAVRASKKQHEEIKQIIEMLDKRLPSVLLEAILVQVTTDNVLNVGVSLQNSWVASSPRQERVSASSPFGLKATRSGDMVVGTGGTIAYFDPDMIFVTLEALQSTGNSKVTSMPRVLVNDNEEGKISNKREEPTTKTTIPAGSDTPIIEFNKYEEAGTTLTIKPHISEGNFLQLEIALDVDSFDGKASGSIPPPKSVNNVTTKVTVPDDKYIVLGGLTSRTEGTTINKVPLLGDIPLLGAMFRNIGRSETEAVLYIFVRAHIVRDDKFSDLNSLSQQYQERLRESEVRHRDESGAFPGAPPRDKDAWKSTLGE